MRKLLRSQKVPSFVVPMGVALVAAGLAGASCGGSVGNGSGGAGTGTHSGTNTGGNSGGASASTSSSSGSATTSSGTGGTSTGPCATNADCAGNPKGSICDATTGSCVKCLPTSDTCPSGQFCDPATNTCATGCMSNADCAGNTAGALICDPQAHKCVNCATDNDCPAGQLCLAGGNVCIPGCSPTHDCPTGETCCGSTCHDLSSDFDHCGSCTTVCTNPVNGVGECKQGMCGVKGCLPAFADCNGDSSDGCEWNQLQDGPCTCTPGAVQSCYQGSPGTQNVGPCKAGTQTCNASGTAWGPCVGQVLPIFEICNNGVDEDCDGAVDNVPDIDGDGWTMCNGDCCETTAQGCANPKLVNPGAYEVIGDGVNNDCDATTSDTTPPVLCSSVAKFSGVTAMNVAQAMDICQTTTAGATGPNKKWGLISATHLLANGATPSAAQLTQMQSSQTSIVINYGTGGVVPKKGTTMAMISSGMARDANDAGFVNPNSGTGFALTSVNPPTVYTNAHGGNLAPGSCAGSACPTGSGAYDSVLVRLVIRVPTNAQGFSYDFRFFSAEYQTYQCTSFNDYYLAILTSTAPGIPADHNISFDALNNPVSVNNGFFQICPGNGKNCGPCPNGTAALAGTGMEVSNTGGGTLWLTTQAPVVGGETMTLDLTIFDVSDDILDSLVVLDNFQWLLTPTTVNTHT